jgi:hypothetical protein
MKKPNNINNYNKLNICYLNSIEKNINSCILNENILTITFSNVDFKKYNNIYVFLKNIKTKELLKCIYDIDENNLIINLKDLDYLCTNYEFSIIAFLEGMEYSDLVHPKFNSNSCQEKTIISESNNGNIKWYLRVLENGKLRLSTIYLFSNYNNELNRQVII